MIVIQLQMALNRVVHVMQARAPAEVDDAANLRSPLWTDRKTKDAMSHVARSIGVPRDERKHNEYMLRMATITVAQQKQLDRTAPAPR
jgi:hypothetical protein